MRKLSASAFLLCALSYSFFLSACDGEEIIIHLGGEGEEGESTYEYPLGPVDEETGEREKRTVPLGPIDKDIEYEGEPAHFYGWSFEVSFPGGSEICPNHLHQYIKDTVVNGMGTPREREERNPPADPGTGDPGGYDSDHWQPDPPPDGFNPATQKNTDGTKSYIDAPGNIIFDPSHRPLHKHTKFKWLLHDCKERELDCKVAEYELKVDANGRVTTSEFTPPQDCGEGD